MKKEQKKQQTFQKKPSDSLILFGKHACLSALKNPRRKCLQIFATPTAADDLPHKLPPIPIRTVDMRQLGEMLPEGSVHQGLAIEVLPLPSPALETIFGKTPVVILDQVTDPHNLGAILRSAAAFGAAAIITTKDNSAPESGTLAKSASGSLELVPIIRVTNLARTMDALKKENYWCIGMDGKAKTTIRQANLSGKIALVLGAEGKGLRHLTETNCDLLVKLPISEHVESLNVSNAAAIALYEIATSQPG